MSTVVRFGACMQSHVSSQVRAELRLEITALVSAGMYLDLLVVRGILVPYPVPRGKRMNTVTLKRSNVSGNRRS